ncbi:hypothetical protein LXL04_002595 [Taraxacum kok-saghyz]
MARTMRMLDVVEDTEYLEHPNKELIAEQACFKGGGTGINEVLKELKRSDARTALFAATPFEPLLRMGDVKGEWLICHMMLLHEIKPTWESVRQKRMHFKVGDHTISYGPDEFCMITGSKKDTTAVSHRALNYAKMCPHFWGVLIGEKENGWLENPHISLWVNLLNEKWQPKDDWTIMPPYYLTLSRQVNSWISCAKGDDKDFRVRLWKDVEKEDLVGLVDDIDFWGSEGVDRKIPNQITFKNVERLTQHSGKLGDWGVFLCMYLEKLVSGREICEVRDTESLGEEFGIRMGKKITDRARKLFRPFYL